MMGAKQRKMEKSLDYYTTYADGIIFQAEHGIGRLMFYEYELNPDENQTGLDKETKNLRLKFEVRVPFRTLKRLSESINARSGLSGIGLDISEGKEHDPKVIEAWHQYNEKVNDLTFDTNFPVPSMKEANELQDSYENLQGRVSKGSNETDEHNQM